MQVRTLVLAGPRITAILINNYFNYNIMDPSKYILHAETTPYKELDTKISWLQNNKPSCHRKIWDLIEYHPITPLSIWFLI